MTRLYRLHPGKPRRLIATFTAEGESDLRPLLETLAESPIYQVEKETYGKPQQTTEVDISQATRSNRNLSVTLSYHLQDGKRHYIAQSKAGVVRGIMEDSNAGATKFWSRLKTVWTNAQLEN